MTDAQALIREAQDKAERLCALAVEQTPAAYQSFITTLISPDRIGLQGGDFTELGVRYRWASE